jgi:hypothetical protein
MKGNKRKNGNTKGHSIYPLIKINTIVKNCIKNGIIEIRKEWKQKLKKEKVAKLKKKVLTRGHGLFSSFCKKMKLSDLFC